jgi:hypothetical protein
VAVIELRPRALPIALDEIAGGAERLKIRRVVGATPDQWRDVVEVLGGTAVGASDPPDEFDGRRSGFEPVDGQHQGADAVDLCAGSGRSIRHPRRECLAMAPAACCASSGRSGSTSVSLMIGS